MKTSHITTAIKSLELQKTKFELKVGELKQQVATRQATIDEIEEEIKALDESINSLRSKIELVPNA